MLRLTSLALPPCRARRLSYPNVGSSDTFPPYTHATFRRNRGARPLM